VAHRPEYVEALRLIAQAFDLAEARGAARPVIVGGSAVEFYTAGAIQCGDIDLVTGAHDLVGDALVEVGFRRECCAGFKQGGFYHGEFMIGVEIVASALYDGRTDRGRLKLAMLDVTAGVVFAPVEDLIADRLGQYESNPAGYRDMLAQARLLRSLVQEIDPAYLHWRVSEECLDPRFIDLLQDSGDADR
jgi:hypothetical protein